MKNSISKDNNVNSISYKDSGVDIDAGNELVERIKPFAKSTVRIGAGADLGGFGALFDLAKCKFKDPILVSTTDGVGTKLKIAIEMNKHDTIGIDLVAMCVNDIIVQGAQPLFFLDYFASSKLSLEIATDVIKGIAAGCKLANCALIGGETAEMPGIYAKGDYDLAGFSVGAVERDQILPQKNVKEGDLLLGLKSSGVHSNGFSLVRHILKERNIDLNHKLSGKKLGELLLEPTKIYVKPCLEVIKTGKAKAFCHITGGGLVENLPRVLPGGLKANINYKAWELPELFAFFKESGNVADHEMYRTFNCGIGMVLVCDPKDQAEIQKILKENGEESIIIGNVAAK